MSDSSFESTDRTWEMSQAGFVVLQIEFSIWQHMSLNNVSDISCISMCLLPYRT